MGPKAYRFLLLLLFAWLQGLAPLLHAHVGQASYSGRAHFHADLLSGPEVSCQHGVQLAQPALHDAPAITLPSGLKGDLSPIALVALPGLRAPDLFPQLLSTSIFQAPWQALPTPPRLLPFSTAPPLAA